MDFDIFVKKLFVDGYKNLTASEVEFQNLSVLVGPNNSGKSNFLEVFGFTRGLIFGADQHRDVFFEEQGGPRGVSGTCHHIDGGCSPIKIAYEILVKTQVTSFLVAYELNIKSKGHKEKKKETNEYYGFISEKLTFKDTTATGKPTTLFRRTKEKLEIRDKNGNFVLKKIERKIPSVQAIKVLYPKLENLTSGFSTALLALFYAIDGKVLFPSPNHIREQIGSGKEDIFTGERATDFDILEAIATIAKDEDLFKEFKDVLCEVLDLEKVLFASIPFPKDLKENNSELPDNFHFLRVKRHGQPSADIREFSDGTLLVTAILSAILSPEISSELICIEEPENCLHPKALRSLVTYLQQKSSSRQLFITTHSPYLLNLVDPKMTTVAYIQDNGLTSFKKISNLKELGKMLKSGFVSFGDLLETNFKYDEEEI